MIHVWKVEGDTLEINKEALLQYPALAAILQRDHYAGKEMAHKEFKYINFIADRNGYCIINGLSKKESHEYAVQHSGLPTTYIPDAKVIAAIQLVLGSLNTTTVERSLQNTIKALHNSAKLADRMADMLEVKVDAATTNDMIQECLGTIKQIQSLAKDIPNQISVLIELQKSWANEQKGGTVRGGKTYSSSLDGDEDLGLDSVDVEELD